MVARWALVTEFVNTCEIRSTGVAATGNDALGNGDDSWICVRCYGWNVSHGNTIALGAIPTANRWICVWRCSTLCVIRVGSGCACLACENLPYYGYTLCTGYIARYFPFS